jgi:hypothetical protein
MRSTPIKDKPRWLRSLFIAVPIGIILGLPFPLLLYLSDAKDWGKGNYANYWDFAWRYLFYGILEVLGAVAIIWLICMFFFWLSHKLNARQP